MDTGENGNFPICAPPLRITADAGLSEELRHKTRHKHDLVPRARGAMSVWLDPPACVYVAAKRTAGRSERVRAGKVDFAATLAQNRWASGHSVRSGSILTDQRLFRASVRSA